jgi:hypothetical protein
MMRRGHAKVAKKGQDPVVDLKEKQLSKLATRGVVLLFNAVAQAQKQQETAGTAATRLTKASFLTRLKGSSAVLGGKNVEKGEGGNILGLSDQGHGSSTAPGWKVLQRDFSGLPGVLLFFLHQISLISIHSC